MYTSDEQVDEVYQTLQATFRSGRTREIAWRKWQLKQLWWLLEDNEGRIIQALHQDLHRHAFESIFAEVRAIKTDLQQHLRNIDQWTADQAPSAGFVVNQVLRPTIRYEPLGVALIVGPWNFPVSLLIQPLMAAITAGCAVLLKPSEVTVATQNLLVDLIPQYLDPTAIRVVTGGAAETTRLMARKFDHIFFTGSVGVARHVAAAAAKHLTPTTLELGGQCPAIVTATADIEAAAREIAWIKFLNSGQICLSVNHVFAHPAVEEQLIRRMTFHFNQFFREGADGMTRIVNQKNFDRLQGLLEKSGGRVETDAPVQGGSPRQLPLSVVSNVDMADPLLSEELFGSICPVVRASTQEAIDSINNLPRPLALYIYSQDDQEVEHVISSTLSGGVTVNGVLVHVAIPEAPFGGVGDSGHGYYHGEWGFKTFSHMRTIARPRPLFRKVSSLVMPPYSTEGLKWLRVRDGMGLKREWSLEDERKLQRRSALSRLASRFGTIAVLFVSLALADFKTGRLGMLRRVQRLIELVRQWRL
ncbi:hypothetical protein EYZ11_007591 [Aspergillus tanneri]|uniref:Aldehyde dehydrogenase n=1 Tax=Aspergillus tanneri TaxID=1220188 RepID=A0A4S3JI74_9EURO|nr:hypothetical protein EYZ11_007591 [Aspergillus tanneri]